MSNSPTPTLIHAQIPDSRPRQSVGRRAAIGGSHEALYFVTLSAEAVSVWTETSPGPFAGTDAFIQICMNI
ncbi:hypothetical protein SCARD494_09434 [Seiridium cardinale]